MHLKEKISDLRIFILLLVGICVIFFARTLLAAHFNAPRLFDLFDALIIAGSIAIVWKGNAELKTVDWLLAAGLGVLVGVGMFFSTLFSPYPFFGIVHGNLGQAGVRGISTFLAALGGLVVMHRGGPVVFRVAVGEVGNAGGAFVFGLLVGLPLAVLNVFALKFTQGQPISWQSPMAALLDALQPAVVEEVVYRFALWGLLWMILKDSMGDKAAWYSGVLSMLTHNYSHYDALFVQSPLSALGIGLVVLIVWGLPPTLLARYKGLEAAIAFHWIQDVTRFLAGF